MGRDENSSPKVPNVRAGSTANYLAAARALGITRARLTQVMKLPLLAPELQRRILLREIDVSERALRAAVGEPDWREQLDLWAPASNLWNVPISSVHMVVAPPAAIRRC